VNKNLMIIAGEASGDLHGASLINELKSIDAGINIFGIGGDKMISAGMIAQFHINEMAFLGFAEVVKHIPFIKKVQKSLLEKVAEEKIKTVVLIDYPGFNLSIAKKLKKTGVKLIYYISPQIWAWGKKRITKIKSLIDKMIVVFPFEEVMYNEAGVDVCYTGHPLLERIAEYDFLSKAELIDKFKLDPDKELLLLMPGSRKQEIEKIFPDCIKAASLICGKFNMQTVIACSENIEENIFDEFTGVYKFTIAKGYTYDFLKHSKFGIIKSGTSTLETALFQLPFIVVYSTSTITYWIGRMLIKLKNIALVNIVAQENIIDELIQKDVNPQNIYNHAERILNNEKIYSDMKIKLGEIKNKLGEPGASKKTAQIVIDFLNDTKRD